MLSILTSNLFIDSFQCNLRAHGVPVPVWLDYSILRIL